MKGGGLKNNAKAASANKRATPAHEKRMEVLLKIEPHIPAAPPHFDERHLTKWNDLLEKIVDAGIWRSLDFDSLQAYVENWVLMEDTMKLVQEQGPVLWIETPSGKKPMRNPAAIAYENAFKVCKVFMEQFGMTPRARQSIIVPDKAPQHDPTDGL